MSSRVAVLASGNGTNAEELFRYYQHHPRIEVVLLLSNNSGAPALDRAKKFGIPSRTFSREQLQGGEVLAWLNEFEVTHIVLAGFLWLTPANLLAAFNNRVINIHPALLPKFGGKGMYGMKVHEQVKSMAESETGITIHLVNEKYDEGKVLFQAKCGIDPNDSPDDIARKVNQLEHKYYPKVIEEWITSPPTSL